MGLSNGARFQKRTKDSAVRRILEKGETYSAVAESVGCSIETICNWVALHEGYRTTTEWRAARRAGKTLATPLPAKSGTTSPSRDKTAANGRALPTTFARRRQKRMALVANAISCPHCGGPIDMSAPITLEARQ